MSLHANVIPNPFFSLHSSFSSVTSVEPLPQGSPTLAPSVLKPLFAHSKHDPSDYNKLEVDESKTTKKLIGVIDDDLIVNIQTLNCKMIFLCRTHV